jgi:hypothetical protein
MIKEGQPEVNNNMFAPLMEQAYDDFIQVEEKSGLNLKPLQL